MRVLDIRTLSVGSVQQILISFGTKVTRGYNLNRCAYSLLHLGSLLVVKAVLRKMSVGKRLTIL